MKRCPSCQKTYQDDAPDYCSNDGMRLVSEEAASYDPEKTMMASGPHANEPAPPQVPPQAPPTSAAPEPQYHAVQPDAPPPSQPQGGQPPQQWQPTGGAQYPQQGWPQPPQPAPQPQATPPAWGSTIQPPQANAPYAAPYALVPAGRSRAFAIAALVFGTCALTIMAMLVMRSLYFARYTMLILSILGIGLGVAALVSSLQKPSRFGGLPLAIAGLSTGVAALVYYFVR
jgi:hypothetical protein